MSETGNIVVVNEAPADPTAAVQAEATARVECERIAGETAVAIAEVHAETDQAAIAAATDARIQALENEVSSCRQNIEILQSEKNATLQTQVIALTPPPQPQEPPPPPSQEPEKSAEAVHPAPEGEAPPAPPKPKKNLNWI